MKTLEELKAFCEGYLACYFGSVDMDVGGVDDWVVWGGYDINLAGVSTHRTPRTMNCAVMRIRQGGWTTSVNPSTVSLST